MEIKQAKISDLKPAEYNPRSLTEEEYKDLENSLKRFGFVEPLVVNSAEGRENVVIGGHQRLSVAQEMGMRELPVRCVKISNIEKERELNLPLNKNLGHFDYDLFPDVEFESEELDDISGLEIDEEFNLEQEKGFNLNVGGVFKRDR